MSEKRTLNNGYGIVHDDGYCSDDKGMYIRNDWHSKVYVDPDLIETYDLKNEITVLYVLSLGTMTDRIGEIVPIITIGDDSKFNTEGDHSPKTYKLPSEYGLIVERLVDVIFFKENGGTIFPNYLAIDKARKAIYPIIVTDPSTYRSFQTDERPLVSNNEIELGKLMWLDEAKIRLSFQRNFGNVFEYNSLLKNGAIYTNLIHVIRKINRLHDQYPTNLELYFMNDSLGIDLHISILLQLVEELIEAVSQFEYSLKNKESFDLLIGKIKKGTDLTFSKSGKSLKPYTKPKQRAYDILLTLRAANGEHMSQIRPNKSDKNKKYSLLVSKTIAQLNEYYGLALFVNNRSTSSSPVKGSFEHVSEYLPKDNDFNRYPSEFLVIVSGEPEDSKYDLIPIYIYMDEIYDYIEYIYRQLINYKK